MRTLKEKLLEAMAAALRELKSNRKPPYLGVEGYVLGIILHLVDRD